MSFRWCLVRVIVGPLPVISHNVSVAGIVFARNYICKLQNALSGRNDRAVLRVTDIHGLLWGVCDTGVPTADCSVVAEIDSSTSRTPLRRPGLACITGGISRP